MPSDSVASLVLDGLVRRAGGFMSPAGVAGRLTILSFHKILKQASPMSPGELDQVQFAQIIDVVADIGQMISLQDAVQGLRTASLPERAMVLTFDDGYVDWLDTACQTLLERRLPATFFLSTEQISGRAHWHERVAWAVHAMGAETELLPIGGGRPVQVRTLQERLDLIAELQEELKYLPLLERDRAMDTLEDMAQVPVPRPHVLGPTAMREIAAMGFEVGAHTHRHPILNCCNDDEAWDEILLPKAELERILGQPVLSFAYPNGRPNTDFSARHVDMVRRAGYQCAVTTAPGAARVRDDAFQLPRIAPWTTNGPRLLTQLAANLLRGSDSYTLETP